MAMDRPAFRNRVASLYNIDKFKVDDALHAAGQEPLSDDDWMKFRSDPPRYFINTDQPTAEAIWACVEARQPKSEIAASLETLHSTMAAAMLEIEALRQSSADAEPGEWWADQWPAEDGHGKYYCYALHNPMGKVIADTGNGDLQVIHQDDGPRFDQPGRLNLEFAAACVNLVRAALAKTVLTQST